MITCRAATASDVPALRAMLQALSDHDGTGPVGPEAALLRHGFGARPLFHAALAEQDGSPVGLVVYYPDFSTHRGQPGLYVQDIFVTGTARGLGAGTALLAPVHTAVRCIFAPQGFFHFSLQKFLVCTGIKVLPGKNL